MNKKSIVFIILGCMLLAGCKSNTATVDDNAEPVSKEVFAMDTYMTVTAYGDEANDAVDAAIKEIQRLDTALSTGNETSEIAQVNNNGGGTVSKETGKLIKESLKLWDSTGGKFDIAIYPLMEAWGFPSGNYTIPDEATLSSLLTLANSSNVVYDKKTKKVSFKQPGMKIDLGGIAKGYTSSQIMKVFKKYNITKGLVSLGGNVQVLGRKTSDSLWKVAIQSPNGDGDYLGVFQAEDCAVITSGGYERYFEQDGVTYHHIIDPATGHPANSGLTSVTIVSDDGTLADGLSTSLFIMGKDEAIKYWQKHQAQFDFILLDTDNNLYVTKGIEDKFTSDLKINVVR